MLTAEFNANTGMAHLCEIDHYYDVKCNIGGFTRIVQLLEDKYGKMSMHSVSKHIIIAIGGTTHDDN